MRPDPHNRRRPVSIIVAAIALAGLAVSGWLLWQAGQPIAAVGPETRAAEVPAESSPPSSTHAPEDRVDAMPAGMSTLPADGSLPPVIPFPFGFALIEAENRMWTNDQNYDEVPRGEQTHGGVLFKCDGLLQLQGSVSKRNGQKFRERIPLPLSGAGLTGTNIASLHLLGGTRNEQRSGMVVAEVLWHYADGSTRRTRLTCQNQIRNWDRPPYETPRRLSYAHSKVVWSRQHPPDSGRWLRLYRTTLANPEPRRELTQLELVSPVEPATLFVVALTFDPLAPGVRPDDSPDLEPTDAPGNRLHVTVQDPTGNAISLAKVSVQMRHQSVLGKWLNSSYELTTDAQGQTTVEHPPRGVERLEVSAEHEDYCGRRIAWDVKAGETIPAAHVFKLTPGITLGGAVVDESDQGVADVKLSFYRFWTGDDDSPNNPKGEQFEFRSKTVNTDATGAWQLKGVPEPVLDRIGFRVEHSDFVGTSVQLNNDAKAEKELRAGTHKLVLKRGLEAWGMVTDDKSQPIADAKVSAGQRYAPEWREATTDARGQFYLKPLAAGEATVTASARGFSPESKKVQVQAGMAPVYFTLSAGTSIMGIVLDESNVPISGVRVMLETWGGPERLPYEFSGATKADGRFEWDSAPNKAMPFSFSKEGYSGQNSVMLEPGKDNIITLKPPTNIKGIVLDDSTGQPVPVFRAGLGSSWSPGQFVNNHDGMKPFTSASGEFELSASAPYHDAIKVEADGYAGKIKQFTKGSEQPQTLTFRLKVSQPLVGTVVNSQGSPVAGAQVAMVNTVGGGGVVRLIGKRLQAFGSGTKIVTTGEDGRFTLGTPSDDGEFNVIAASSEGVGWASVDQVRASGLLTIQSNGRIEGTLTIAGQPAAGHSILFNLSQQGIHMDFNQVKTTTDDAGKFTFEEVPAGEGNLVRLIQTEENSWIHSHNTSVTVKPGETTYVTLGDSGAVLRGRIRYVSPPDASSPVKISGGLSTAMPPMPQFKSSEEAQAFMATPEWKERAKLMKYYSFVVRTDGSFQVDSIPPGNYTLNIGANKPKEGGRHWETIPVATGSLPVNVPDSANPYSPIDVGEVLLKPFGAQTMGN